MVNNVTPNTRSLPPQYAGGVTSEPNASGLVANAVNIALQFGISPTSAATDNDAAFAAAFAFAQSTGKALYLPGGGAYPANPYKISAALGLTGGNVQLFGDIGFTTIQQETKAANILSVGGQYLTLTGISFVRDSSITVDASTGFGMQVLGTLFAARIQNCFFYRNYRGIFADTGNAFFSCQLDNNRISYTAGSAICIREGTGNVWSNTYCNNDEFTAATGTLTEECAVTIETSQGGSFNQLNIEGYRCTTSLRQNGGNSVVNGLHIERAQYNGFGSQMLRCIGGSLVVNDAWLGFSDFGFSPGGGEDMSFARADFAGRIILNGLVQPGGSGTNVNTGSVPVTAARADQSSGIDQISLNNVDLTGVTIEPLFTAGVVNVNEKRYGIQQIAYAATITPNIALAAGDQAVNIAALTGALTLAAPTNIPKQGSREIVFFLLQDATGGRVITWNAAYKLATLTASGTANQKAQVTFRSDGSNLVQIASTGWYS